MKVANIVSVNKVNVSDDFNVVGSLNNIIQGLPTLIVGIETVIKEFQDFDILKIEIKEGFYWTFRRTDRRDKYQEDLAWFIRKVYNDRMKDIIYVFVDPIQYRAGTLRKIVKKILTITDVTTYVHDEMIYIYGENLIFGVDLKLLRYMGVDIVKIKNKIKRISKYFLDDIKILIEYKKDVETLGNKVRYIPCLYTIRNGENNTSSLIHIPREG
jgi:hypothetical protein